MPGGPAGERRPVKVMLIGDVHGNLPALLAVVRHAEQQGVTRIWNVGDFVGYGPYPDEVVSYLRDRAALNITGNYDLNVLNFPAKAEKWRHTKHPLKYLAFRWAYEQLSSANRAFLRALPPEARLKAGKLRVLLVHGSPASDKEHLTVETPVARLRELARMADAEVILCGHSHQQFARQTDGVWFVNPGSVGRPDDGDPRASYAILHLKHGTLAAEHYRVAYDVQATVEALRAAHLPEAFAQMLLQGRDLNAVLAAGQE